MTRPRVLWISDELPDRGGGGGNIRQAHLLAGLSATVDIDLLVTRNVTDELVRRSTSSITVVDGAVRRPPRSPWARRLLQSVLATGFFGPADVWLSKPTRRALSDEATRLAAQVDHVVVVHAHLASLLPRGRRQQWWLHPFHVTSTQLHQAAAIAGRSRERWLLRRQASIAARFEQRWTAAYDRLVVVCRDDGRLLGPYASMAPLVVPNGVDLDQFRASPLPQSHQILFTGTLSFPPNVDGAIWLASELLPSVRSRVEDATVVIAGRSPVPEVQALGRLPGVTVLADPISIVPALTASRVAVVPLRSGTGTRLKALEALAAGRPVVGTSVGLQGLGLTSGQNALECNTAEGLSQAIGDVLVDDDLAQQLISGGAAVAEASSWGACVEPLARAMALPPDGQPPSDALTG